MENSDISAWVRQLRHRGLKQGYTVTVTVDELRDVVDHYNGCCTICDAEAVTFDTIFFRSIVPVSQANVYPVCMKCKDLYCQSELPDVYFSDAIDKERYVNIIKYALTLNGGETIRLTMRKTLGLD